MPNEARVPDHLFKAASDALYGARNANRSMDLVAADMVAAVLKAQASRRQPGMYRVDWAIDIEHSIGSPFDAAAEALRIQRDPESIAVVFVVDGQSIDLLERSGSMSSPAASREERIHWTQAELCDEARRRFGDDPKQWKFVCPSCGDVTCAQDFLDAGVDPQKLGQECIGRQLGALAKPKATNERGCDWCAYGLFRGPWLITMPDGTEAGSFRLAPA